MTDNNEIIHVHNEEELPISNPYQSIDKLVEEFLAQHDVRKSSRDRYRKSLKQFLDWAQGRDIVQITRESLLEYKESLHIAKKSTKTIGAYLVAIRLFYEYLDQKYDIKNVAKGIHSPKQENKFEHNALTEDQCTQLLEHYKKAGNIRDYAMINLMLRTGMRTIEISRALIEDIGKKDGADCLFLHGKGRDDKKEFVLLTAKALELLKEYLATRGAYNPSDSLFISESNNGKGTSISTKTISSVAREGLDAIGLYGKDGYTAHSCRHSAGSIMLTKGVPLDQIKKVLRHKNVSTTLGYVTMAEEKKRIQDAPENTLDDAF